MSSKAIVFLVGIFAIMAVMAVTVPQGAEAHEGDGKEDKCDTYICVTVDSENKMVKVGRAGDPYHWGILKITTLRDNTHERGGEAGQNCDNPLWTNPDDDLDSFTYCSYDDSQQSDKWDEELQYVCQGNESRIGIYVVYRNPNGIRSLPNHSGDDMIEVWTHSLKFKVSCGGG